MDSRLRNVRATKRLLASATLLLLAIVCSAADASGCPQDSEITFLLQTGYMFASPEDVLTTHPDTLMLADCIDSCRNITGCKSANYESGTCELHGSSARQHPDLLVAAQYPVFTLYVERMCLQTTAPCDRLWTFERVPGYRLVGFFKKKVASGTEEACMRACLEEKDFICRSATFRGDVGECGLSEMDRHAVTAVQPLLKESSTVYLESNCAYQPSKRCRFNRMEGKTIKTVDSIVKDVDSLEVCQSLCLSAPYRCHSLDFSDKGEKICRLSHHSSASLTIIPEPYLSIPGSVTYEVGPCFDVKIHCRATEMGVEVITGKMFDGRMYSMSSPSECTLDLSNSVQFELRVPYESPACYVEHDPKGKFVSKVIIQKHDIVQTDADHIVLAKCEYHLHNTTIYGSLGLRGFRKNVSEESTPSSPKVTMRVLNARGDEAISARIGDPLLMRFEVEDGVSPYHLVVRDLLAVDGHDIAEVRLVDDHGCSYDSNFFGPVRRAVTDVGQDLEAPFKAFRFPGSEVVSFRALVTPCFPNCYEAACEGGSQGESDPERLGWKEVPQRRKRNFEAESGPRKGQVVVHTIRIRGESADSRKTSRDGKEIAKGVLSPVPPTARIPEEPFAPADHLVQRPRRF